MCKIKKFLVFPVSLLLLFSFLPGLTADAYDPGFDTNAASVSLYNMETGAALYEKNAATKTAPAATVQVMTALLVLDNVSNLDEPVTITESMLAGVEDSDLKPGEAISVQDLLNGMLLSGKAEFANALAEYVGQGSAENFVAMMNTRAGSLGVQGTNFTNPSGLADDNQYTTAYDMTLITKAACQYPLFLEISEQAMYVMPATNLADERVYYNSNMLINAGSANYDSRCIGGKSAYQENAGYCLISIAESDEMRYICVMLGGSGENNPCFAESSKLYDWAYDGFSVKKVYSEGDIAGEVKVSAGKKVDHVIAVAKNDVYALVPNDFELEQMEKKPQLTESVMAPVQQGDSLGTLVLSNSGISIGSVDLVAQHTVERSFGLYLLYWVGRFFANTIVKTILILIVVFILLYLLLVWYLNRRRPKRTAAAKNRPVKRTTYSSRSVRATRTNTKSFPMLRKPPKQAEQPPAAPTDDSDVKIAEDPKAKAKHIDIDLDDF